MSLSCVSDHSLWISLVCCSLGVLSFIPSRHRLVYLQFLRCLLVLDHVHILFLFPILPSCIPSYPVSRTPQAYLSVFAAARSSSNFVHMCTVCMCMCVLSLIRNQYRANPESKSIGSEYGIPNRDDEVINCDLAVPRLRSTMICAHRSRPTRDGALLNDL